jgi:hypothetical protein
MSRRLRRGGLWDSTLTHHSTVLTKTEYRDGSGEERVDWLAQCYGILRLTKLPVGGRGPSWVLYPAAVTGEKQTKQIGQTQVSQPATHPSQHPPRAIHRGNRENNQVA